MPSALTACLTVAAAMAIVGASRPVLPQQVGPADTLRVQVAEHGVLRVRVVPREDYVAATALSEFAPAAGDPAAVEAMYEVQTIISRTYAASHRGRHAQEGFDLCSTTHCQLYEPGRLTTSRWAPAVRDAVARTAGMVLMYDGAPADALFHSDCGGRTSAAADVWGSGNYPYLISRKDDGPARAAHRDWRYAVDSDALRQALNADPRTAAGRRFRGIRIAARDGAGRAQRLTIRGDKEVSVRGTDLREVVANRFGAQSLRSTLFQIKTAGRRLVFSGRGYGHGVGLCQVGAFARVSAGVVPLAVIEYYYPGTLVSAGLRDDKQEEPAGDAALRDLFVAPRGRR